MINLLPPATKKDFLYARRNTMLVHWALVLGIILTGGLLITAGGLIYVSQLTRQAESNNISAQKALESQNIKEAQKNLEEISSNVKLTTQVLSKEILFSKLLKDLGGALPANSALAQLQINDIKGGITLSANASDFESASQIQVNLADPKNAIFEKADIESIDCATTEDSDNTYPCTVVIRALFVKNNPFLYITSNSTGTR